MIRIITTGGTIEGLEYDRVENKPKEVDVQLTRFFEVANVSFEYVFDFAFQKDSRFITSEDRELLASKIASSPEDKILITHGTISMVETAKFLGVLRPAKTVVLVGSFVLGSEERSDAPFNLGYAMNALQTLDEGVYIAMNGAVFSWENVTKNVKENRFEKEF